MVSIIKLSIYCCSPSCRSCFRLLVTALANVQYLCICTQYRIVLFTFYCHKGMACIQQDCAHYNPDTYKDIYLLHLLLYWKAIEFATVHMVLCTGLYHLLATCLVVLQFYKNLFHRYSVNTIYYFAATCLVVFQFVRIFYIGTRYYAIYWLHLWLYCNFVRI